MKDLIKVRVVEACKVRSLVSDQAVLRVTLEPYETLVLHGEEVGYLYTTVTDVDVSASWGWRQAQMRYVLGLLPVYRLGGEKPEVPAFSDKEVGVIPGKDIVVAVDFEDVPTLGVRLHVLDFYRPDEKPEPEGLCLGKTPLMSELRTRYAFSLGEAAKAEMLLLWFHDVAAPSMKSVEMDEFDVRYEWLFGERPLFYEWGPFYRDHGFVGVRDDAKRWILSMLPIKRS